MLNTHKHPPFAKDLLQMQTQSGIKVEENKVSEVVQVLLTDITAEPLSLDNSRLE